MKLFKKVMAVVLVGAMAVSMLTACSSSSSKTKDIKKALKDVGVTTTTTMNNETDKTMSELQSAAVKIQALDKNDTDYAQKAAALVTEEQGKLKAMTQYTFSNEQGTGDYDLYIWTNGATHRKTENDPYPYLKKVDYTNHVNSAQALAVLLSKEFVEKGVFSGSTETMNALKSVLDAATDANGKKVTQIGLSCQKVYGMDVLLVTAPKGTVITQEPAAKVVK